MIFSTPLPRPFLTGLIGPMTILLSGCAMTPLPTAAPQLDASAALPAYFAALRARGETIVSAHRGAPRPDFPENTLAAYAGLPDGLIVETDIRPTRDGVLMLSHDDTLDRTTTLSGQVSAHDWSEIRQARTRDPLGVVMPYSPATLPDLLAATDRNRIIQLDIKEKVSIDAVMDAVEAATATHRVIYLSYADDQIRRIITRHPDAVIATVIPSIARLNELTALGLRPQNLHALFFESAINPALFAHLRAQGVMVLVAATQAEDDPTGWRPLPPERYVAIRKAGADIIVSDFPLEAETALHAAGTTAATSVDEQKL